jgi:signal transduction histidine kinase
MEEKSDISSINIEAFNCIFRDVSASMHAHTRAADIANLVVRRVAEVLRAKGAAIRTIKPEEDQSEVGAAYGLSERYLGKGPVFWGKIINDLCRVGEVRVIKDILNDPRVQYPKEAWEEGIRMIVDAPLTLREDTVGVIRVYFAEERELNEEELNFLVFTSRQGACAIREAGLIETQRSQYDHLALQTEKLSALGRMAAGIAHEINNPLAGILLYSSNIVKKAPEGPIKEGLEVIISETRRCKTIIQELLEFSREGEPKTALGNINQIIEKALHILENEFRLKRIRVKKQLSSGMKDILLDENQIEQVLVNLMLNAVEAIQGDGAITIRSQVDTGQEGVRVEIADTGCGIAPENLPKIFEPFFSTKSKGTGLGLAVSYGIIQKHGGNIQVVSQPGEGTRFTVEFPLGQGSSTKAR